MSSHRTGGDFMRVKVKRVGKGLHPNEVVVEVKTTAGTERLVIDKRALHANSLSVGAPIQEKQGQALVELPRETMTGSWRVWVKKDKLSPDRAAAAA